MSAKLTIPIPAWLDFIFTCPLLACRLLRYGYSYRKIYLSEGKHTIVDQKDYYWLNSFKWMIYGRGDNLYAIRNKLVAPNETRPEYMHRLIMNHPKGLLVDHQNCDSLDNRRQNLRLATRSQNMHNRRKKKKCTSKYHGVWFSNGKYQTEITNQGKKYWLGWYDSEIDAAKAYDRAAIKYHGEFARLNFPRENYVNEVGPS